MIELNLKFVRMKKLQSLQKIFGREKSFQSTQILMKISIEKSSALKPGLKNLIKFKVQQKKRAMIFFHRQTLVKRNYFNNRELLAKMSHSLYT